MSFTILFYLEKRFLKENEIIGFLEKGSFFIKL
jgi:hypothetical protein